MDWLYALLIFVLLSACKSKYPTLNYSESKVTLPFVKEYKGADKSVFVYGSYHTNDSIDKEVKDIEQKILEFKPDVILYEGDYIDVEATKYVSVSNYFEMGLVR